jgi:protoporphyrin/coproporphyrin ferrochelatase
MKLAIVLFNLGGPGSPEAVEPFLRNLFSDPSVISLPTLFRKPLARFVAKRRAPFAREIYAKIGGCSPILGETQAQAQALEKALEKRGHEARAFIAMRCWKPFSDEAAAAINAYQPERIVLLPLYPQFSTTTTASSLADWQRAANAARLSIPTSRVCCYPAADGFISAMARLIASAQQQARTGISYRLLLSAHGLPQRTIKQGDPYQWQSELTAKAIVQQLNTPSLDWTLCYQSRVGPLAWIGPATDAEIRRAGAEGKGIILAPIAFVSEHSETLVELDIEYRKLAEECGILDYIRVPAARTAPDFIDALAQLVQRAIMSDTAVTCGTSRLCPTQFSKCGFA